MPRQSWLTQVAEAEVQLVAAAASAVAVAAFVSGAVSTSSEQRARGAAATARAAARSRAGCCFRGWKEREEVCFEKEGGSNASNEKKLRPSRAVSESAPDRPALAAAAKPRDYLIPLLPEWRLEECADWVSKERRRRRRRGRRKTERAHSRSLSSSPSRALSFLTLFSSRSLPRKPLHLKNKTHLRRMLAFSTLDGGRTCRRVYAVKKKRKNFAEALQQRFFF